MHTPAEGRKVAGEEEKCTQCMERNLLCAVQVEHLAQSTLRRHNQPFGTIISPAQSTFQHTKPSSTGNIAAKPTLRHNHHFGTITILAQHCGRVSPPAQSTVRHIHHSGTVNIPAQSTIQHHHHCGTRCWKHPDTPLHNSMIDAVNYGT